MPARLAERLEEEIIVILRRGHLLTAAAMSVALVAASPAAAMTTPAETVAARMDPGSPLRSRIGPPEALVVEAYRRAGASDIKAHELTDAEWAIVDTALAKLPPLHRRILQGHLRRLSFVDLKPGAGSALTSRADPDGKGDVFDITLRASLLNESLTDFLNTKEGNLFQDDGSGLRVRFDAGRTDALSYILLHEATHVVDQALGLTADSAGPFRARTWVAPRQLAEPYASSLAAKTWFRGAPRIPVGQAPAYYRALARTPFVSFYATAAASEDLAELTAWRQLASHGQKLLVQVLDGRGHPVSRYEPLKSAAVQRRFALVKRLLVADPPASGRGSGEETKVGSYGAWRPQSGQARRTGFKGYGL